MYWLLLCALGAYVLIMSFINLAYRFRIPRGSARKKGPLVSVLVPARNEENHIGACLDSLLGQTYGNYEILVLDDGSTDRTADVLAAYAKRHPRLRVLSGAAKPAGWRGKTFAVHQLAREARGEILYMTDADTVHHPQAVAWAVDRVTDGRLDAFSAMPRQLTRTFSEKLIVPIVYLPMFMIPYKFMNSRRNRKLSFAIGQFFVFRKEAYEGIGGMAAVKGRITEDQALSRLLKKRGYHYQFLDSRGLVECRMYGTLKDCLAGFAKNFHEMVAFFPAVMALLILVMLILVIGPLALLAGSLLTGGASLAAAAASVPGMLPASPFLLTLPVAAFFLGWTVNLAYYRPSWYMPLLYPLFFITLAYMLSAAIFNLAKGKNPVWKSRVLSASP